jgi:hypothetical protein
LFFLPECRIIPASQRLRQIEKSRQPLKPIPAWGEFCGY